MKLYFKAILLLALMVTVFGGIGPFLVSSSHTALVMLGGVITVISIPVFLSEGIPLFNEIIKRFD